MLSFSKVTADNILEIAKYFQYQDFRTCDYTIGGLYMWKDYFQSEYAVSNGNLVIKNISKDGLVSFSYPVGNGGAESALAEIAGYAAANGVTLIFDSAIQPIIERLRSYFGNGIEEKTSDGWADYLYNKDDLVYLKGKKYSGQRNHINKFINSCNSYSYVRIDKGNIQRVKNFFEVYLSKALDKGGSFHLENDMTNDMLERFFDFSLLGGFIEVEKEIVAFSIGEIVEDTLFVHIEKAIRDFPGAYAMMNMQFAKNNTGEIVRYINREEDLGDEGLRKAKMSYHPCELLQKHYVFVK